MLRASRCPYLTVNTHNIDEIQNGDDLPVGYAAATLASVRSAWTGQELSVVLNINLPITAAEAVTRAQRTIELTGESIVKLEVLDPSHSLSDTSQVVDAATILTSERDSVSIWPLVTPDIDAFEKLQDLGCPLIRIMGSAIGSCSGIDVAWLPTIERILDLKRVHVMLDGGVGGAEHVARALNLGFDSVLVNSCLFADGGAPVDRLQHLRATIDQLERTPHAVPV
jgi:thiazole synthase